MLPLQAPPRNLFSRRVAQAAAPADVVDYLDALRGLKPTWGDDDVQSPQRRAAEPVAGLQFTKSLYSRLKTMTSIRHCRQTDTDPLSRIVSRYVEDVAALSDQVDAINRLFTAIALSQAQMPMDTDHSFFFAPSTIWQDSERRKVNEEKARHKVASSLFAPKAPAVVLGPPAVSARLLVMDRASLLAACQEDVVRRCQQVSVYAAECLIAGVASGLLGIVSWHSGEVCWYVRNERHCRPKGHWASFSYDLWQAVKEVTLIDAMHLQGVPGWLEPPAQVQNVVNAIPPILHPEVGTVVGTMVKERQISWKVGEVTLPAEEVTPRPRVVADPAIVIGRIVLTGWESPEHRRPGWWQRLDCALARG